MLFLVVLSLCVLTQIVTAMDRLLGEVCGSDADSWS